MTSNTNPENDIQFNEVIKFFSDYWKMIVLFSILGVFVSLARIFLLPNMYIAEAQIQLIQVNTNKNSNVVLHTNFEDPNLVLARLKAPTNFSIKEFNACGLIDSKSPGEALTGVIKSSKLKGVESVIELKVQMSSREQAINCLESIFQNIKDSQARSAEPFVKEAQQLLKSYLIRLKNAQEIVLRADQSGAALSAAYLSNRDEVRFLTDEIFRLNSLINEASTRQTKLVLPIYASEIPVSPNKRSIFISGLFGGLFIGFLLILFKRATDACRRIKQTSETKKNYFL